MIKRLVQVCVITFLISYGAGLTFDSLYKKRWSELFFKKMNELTKGKVDYDVIYLGNSRVHFGINPFYVDSITNYNSYNFGIGGADAEDIMVTIYTYLAHHNTPKITIISLDKGMLRKQQILKTRFHYLFYLENDTINKYMNQAGFITPIIKYLPFTKYSFFNEYNRTSIFVKGKPYPVFGHNIYKGFLNVHQYMNTNAAGLFNTNQADEKEVWIGALVDLKNSVATLQKAGSEVIFVFPPEKASSIKRENTFKNFSDSTFKKIANEYHLKYWHFESNLDYKDGYFVDDIHLNEPGTKIFSMQLADSINKFYPNIK